MPENIEHQYRIIADGAGWIDRADRGYVRLAGLDSLTFLQALVTNDVGSLVHGAGAYAAYLSPQGRMIADLDVFHRGAFVLASVAAGVAPRLAATLDRLIFAEDLAVTDASGAWTEIAVTGTGAAAVLGGALSLDETMLMALAETAQVDHGAGFVARGGESPFPMFRIIVPPVERRQAIARLESAGAVPLSASLATALRIEAGRPAWGADLFDDTIPLEAGLAERAISTTKGCYVGQEVIIRILHRGGGRVAKRLVVLALPAGSGEAPAAGTSLTCGAEITGRITSAAFSPGRGAVVALGYVHRNVAEVGTRVLVGAGETEATIVGLAG